MKMSDCDICKIMENKEAFKVIYEDDSILALLHESPAVAGHCLVIPKKHYPILEEVPDKVLADAFTVANAVSSSIFDALGVHGTNIIVNNGLSAGQEHAHFLIHVLPRSEDDKLDFEWHPKKVSEEGLATTLSIVNNFAQIIFSGKQLDVSKVKVREESPEEPEQNYLLKQLKRIP